MIRNASLDFPSKRPVPLHRIGEDLDGFLWSGFRVGWAAAVATPVVAWLCGGGGQFDAFRVRRRAGSGDELLHWGTASVNTAFYDTARTYASTGAGWSNHGGIDDGRRQ